MPKTSVLNIKGEQVGEIELSDVLFGAEVNTEAMHTLVVNYLANQRQGTQSTKTRTEVRGGGKKPWDKKEQAVQDRAASELPSGRAAVLLLGPKPRSHRFSVNKKASQRCFEIGFDIKA